MGPRTRRRSAPAEHPGMESTLSTNREELNPVENPLESDALAARDAALPAPPLSWLGTAPPPESIVTQAQALGLVDAAQLGGFSAWWFGGNDAAAHIRQAQNVLPLLLRSYLAPRWRRGVLV